MSFNKVTKEWKKHLKNEHFRKKLYFALAIFFIGVIILKGAGNYADSKPNGTEQTDIVLNNIPAINANFFNIYGFYIVLLLIAYLLLTKPITTPLAIKLFGLLIITRGIFIFSTQLNPSYEYISMHSNYFKLFYFDKDLFFSGHASIPFMAYLLNKKNKFGSFFLAMSILLALGVLLSHIHYTIDILGAYFITFTVYYLGVNYANMNTIRKKLNWFKKEID